MGYRIRFDNGHEVEFETKPSDADIDEAYQATLKLPKPESKSGSGFMDEVGKGMKQFGEIALDTLGALPIFGGKPPKDEAIRGPAEAIAHAGTSMGGFLAGLGLAGVEKPIAAAHQHPP
jgi:hypothetical protein